MTNIEMGALSQTEKDKDKDKGPDATVKERSTSTTTNNTDNATTDINTNNNVETNTPPDGATLSQTLHSLVQAHELDQNFPQDILARARAYLSDHPPSPAPKRGSNATTATSTTTHDPEVAQALIADFKHQHHLALTSSAYPEVRAVVDPTDDPSVPVGTIRVFVMGTFFTIAGTAIHQFFSLRMPSISISTYVVQLLSMPLGVAMARCLPRRIFTVGWPGSSASFSFTLNPGPFSQKEHLLIAMMSNVSFGGHSSGAYVTQIIQVLHLDRFYGEKILSQSVGWQVCTLIATQFIGYGCAGMARRFLVYPSAMIWQRSLANIALTKALSKDNGADAKKAVNGWVMSRYRFFLITFLAMFVWFWVPNYFFEGLGLFNWPTWIAPGNVNLAIIAGGFCGLGLNPLPTLDWNVATHLADPIVTPLFTILNFAAGMAIVGFIIVPIGYWSNVWNAGYLPINGNKMYDNTGGLYNMTRILNDDLSFNEAGYLNYSIPRMPMTKLFNFSAYLALYLAVPMHMFLWHRKDIVDGLKSAWNRKPRAEEFKDVHNRLMSEYPECPLWWYMTILVSSFVLACISVSVWPTGMPIWGIVMAIAFAIVVQIPVGMLAAITNVEMPTVMLSMLVGGYVLEGQVVPNMVFKMFSGMAIGQSLNFVADLKMAHYAKIPPRWAFAAQVYATFLAGFVSLGVNHWVLRNVEDVCAPDQKDKFVCPWTYGYFTMTVLWGVIGPRRLYGPGAPYSAATYMIPLGVVIPLVVYFARRRWPSSFWRNVNSPVLIAGPLGWAPYNWSFMQGSVVLGLFFNWFIKTRYRSWWERYAYVLTGSFSAATGMAALVIYFALQKWGIRLDWWGNNIARHGVDAGGFQSADGLVVKCANLVLAPGKKFDSGL